MLITKLPLLMQNVGMHHFPYPGPVGFQHQGTGLAPMR